MANPAEELVEDFGDGLPDSELRRLIREARASGNRDVRRLAKHLLKLRQGVRVLLEDLERCPDTATVREGRAANFVRFLALSDWRPDFPAAEDDVAAS